MTRTLAHLASLALLGLAVACPAPPPPPGPTPQEELAAKMQKLADADRAVNDECFGKLSRREIPSNRSYVECYVAKVRPAYQQYGPENLDLLDSLAKQWRAIADQVDAGKMKAAEAQSEMAKIKTGVEAEAQRRAAEAEALAASEAGANAQESNVEGASAEAIQNRKMLEQGLHDKAKPNPSGIPGRRGGG